MSREIQRVHSFYLQDTDEKTAIIFKKLCDGSSVKICEIYFNPTINNCCFTSNGDNVQTYIVDWESYTDFVNLLDTAYDLINSIHGKGWED